MQQKIQINFQNTESSLWKLAIQQLESQHNISQSIKRSTLELVPDFIKQSKTFNKQILLKLTDLSGEPLESVNHTKQDLRSLKDMKRSTISIVDKFFKNDNNQKNRNEFQQSIYSQQNKQQYNQFDYELRSTMKRKDEQIYFLKELLDNQRNNRIEDKQKILLLEASINQKVESKQHLISQYKRNLSQKQQEIQMIKRELKQEKQRNIIWKKEIESKPSALAIQKKLQQRQKQIQTMKNENVNLKQQIERLKQNNEQLRINRTLNGFNNYFNQNNNNMNFHKNNKIYEHNVIRQEQISKNNMLKLNINRIHNKAAIDNILEKFEQKIFTVGVLSKVHRMNEQKIEKLEKKYFEQMMCNQYLQTKTAEIVDKYQLLEHNYNESKERKNKYEFQLEDQIRQKIKELQIVNKRLNNEVSKVQSLEYKLKLQSQEFSLINNKAQEKQFKINTLQRQIYQLKRILENSVEENKRILYQKSTEKSILTNQIEQYKLQFEQKQKNLREDCKSKVAQIQFLLDQQMNKKSYQSKELQELAQRLKKDVNNRDQQLRQKNKMVEIYNQKFKQQQTQLHYTQQKLHQIQNQLNYFQEYTQNTEQELTRSLQILNKKQNAFSKHQSRLFQLIKSNYHKIFNHHQQAFNISDYDPQTQRQRTYKQIISIIQEQTNEIDKTNKYIKKLQDKLKNSNDYIMQIEIEYGKIISDNNELIQKLREETLTKDTITNNNYDQLSKIKLTNDKLNLEIQELKLKNQKLEQKLEKEINSKSWIEKTLNSIDGKSKIEKIQNDRILLFQRISKIVDP